MPESPAPEVLQPQDDDTTQPADDTASAATAGAQKSVAKPRRLNYHPSHKATFIGLAVVLAVLGVNAIIVVFLMGGQSNAEDRTTQRKEVVVSTEALEKLGVNKEPIGNLGTELVVGPDSRFNGKVTVSGDTDIAGQLKLNGKISAADASLTKLQAGDTSLTQLNVNGDGTLSNLNLRSNLAVVGSSRLQGATTVDNNMTVAGNLTVGGTLFAGVFQATNLVAGSTLTIGGHVMVRGSAPGVSAGGAVGSNGSVSISGTDTAGTVAVNIGAGAASGILANISFHDKYDSTPHVVITAVGRGAGDVYINRTSTGFSIVTPASLPAGGYAFDYVVVQ